MTDSAATIPSNPASEQPTPMLPLLQKGHTGDAVRILQFVLNSKSFLFQPSEYLQIDGLFGTRTEDAVRYFQSVTNLPVDGIVGLSTWSILSLPEGMDLR